MIGLQDVWKTERQGLLLGDGGGVGHGGRGGGGGGGRGAIGTLIMDCERLEGNIRRYEIRCLSIPELQYLSRIRRFYGGFGPFIMKLHSTNKLTSTFSTANLVTEVAAHMQN